jgi:asparagine synthase (glutamine-hydrolysing)
MSGVAAVLRLGGVDVDPQELLPVLTVLQRRGPDGTGHLCVGPVVLGCARLDSLPEDGHQPVRCGQVIAVADARLDNRDELCRDLRLPHQAADAALIAAAIAKWGACAPERLEGDFAVVAWDGDDLLAFRDRFGVKPLFYVNTPGHLLVASEISALIAHRSVPVGLDQQYFLEYLAARKPPTPLTPYQAIRRLMPSEIMIASRGGSTLLRYYYRLQVEASSAALPEIAERTRALVDKAVATRLRSNGPIACDVSGGMDSTSIYATARALGLTPCARSIVSDRWPQIDEREFSRDLVGDAPWMHIYAEEHPPLTDIHAVAARFDEPVQDVLLGQLRLALDDSGPAGCRVALSGHGGDALMAGGFDSIRAAIYGCHWWTAYREARQWADERDRSVLFVLRWALQRSYVLPSRLPWASHTVSKRARAAVRQVRRFLRAADQGIDSIDTFLLSVQAGLRQKPSGAMETRYPFLYRPLVEYALSTPDSLKVRGAIGKRVMRQAMRDRLPASILERAGKTPFDLLYAWGFRSQWQTVETLINSSVLVEWGLLDSVGTRRLVTDVRDGKTTRLVEAIYFLAIEAWLQSPPSLRTETARTSLSAAGRFTESRLTEVGGR